jgi:predicted nucleotidyltransferase
MENEIKALLNQVSKSEKIRILYACESGSRAWGFPSPDSDYDARFIYVYPQEKYLLIDEKQDTMSRMDGDLDVGGWELRKLLRLLRKSNAVIFEWLQSPIIYHDEVFRDKLWDVARDYFSPRACIHHYLGLAINSYGKIKGQEEIKLKTYFYIIRPLLAALWIVKKNEIPPMELSKLLPIAEDQELVEIIEDLRIKKQTLAEAGLIKPIAKIETFILENMAFTEQQVATMERTSVSTDKLNQFFRETIALRSMRLKKMAR